jgi:prepilin-type N-terminal cleavage/methylation domain-containing protein
MADWTSFWARYIMSKDSKIKSELFLLRTQAWYPCFREAISSNHPLHPWRGRGEVNKRLPDLGFVKSTIPNEITGRGRYRRLRLTWSIRSASGLSGDKLFQRAERKICFCLSNRAGAIAQPPLGFTLIELITVVAIISIMLVAGMVGYNHYKDQYAFRGAERELTHAITLARMQAIQTQTTSRLLFRPRLPNPIPAWKTGQAYNVGDIVVHLPSTYRCTVAHVANAGSAGNEPAVGTWTGNWEVVFDHQYNDLLVDVQHCASHLPSNADPCQNPNVCAWVQTNPYDIATPVSIQFNPQGVPVDYIDHNILIQGVQDAAGPPGQNRVGCVTLTVTSLGKIRR